MDTRDQLEIREVLARYGFVVDDRDWGGFEQVFTEDGECDLTAWQVPLMRGLDAIRETYADIQHPEAHCTMNVIVTETSPDTARVRSKILAVRPDRRVETAEYHDEVRRTAAGWRIARRIVVPKLSTDSWDVSKGQAPESAGSDR